MPLPLLAVGMLALPILSSAGKGMKDNQVMLLVAGLGAYWLFNKVQEPFSGLRDAYQDLQGKIDMVGDAVSWTSDQVDIVPEVRDFWTGLA